MSDLKVRPPARLCRAGSKEFRMNANEMMAEQFEANRSHLRAVAYRMLGSLTEADDAVQEAWLRLSRSESSDIQNLGGWLTTVVARVCLDLLRSRKAKAEQSLEEEQSESVAESGTRVFGKSVAASDPEQEAILAESVGLALLVVLDTLAPAERLAFVLHDWMLFWQRCRRGILKD